MAGGFFVDKVFSARHSYIDVRNAFSSTILGGNMITSRVTSKGQITIPKRIRDLLQIQRADQVVFTPLEEGKILMTNKRNPPSVLFGMLSHRKRATPVPAEEMDAAIHKRRGERMSR